MESVLVKHQAFTIIGNDGVRDGACFYIHPVPSPFSKVSGLYTLICCFGRLHTESVAM